MVLKQETDNSFKIDMKFVLLFGEMTDLMCICFLNRKVKVLFTIQVGGNVELTGIAAAAGGNLSLSAPSTPPQLH